MVHDSAIDSDTMSDWYTVVYGLLSGVIFNDLRWPLTQISTERHY